MTEPRLIGDIESRPWDSVDGNGRSILLAQASLEELVAAGTIRAYGWSTDFPDRVERWVGGSGFKAIQSEINVLADNPGIWDVGERNGLTCLIRGPLAMGLLSGKYTSASKIGGDDVRGMSPDWLRFDNRVPNPEFLSRLDAVREVLTSGGRSLVQGAIAWMWGRSSAAIPIPGVRTVTQAKENAEAMEFGPLTSDQMEEIARLLT